MSKTITLNLKKGLIFEAVKTDTFMRAQADKSDNPVANAARAYCEAAGDETFHMRKLLRLLRSGLAKFATMMNEFVDTENGTITYTLSPLWLLLLTVTMTDWRNHFQVSLRTTSSIVWTVIGGNSSSLTFPRTFTNVLLIR